MLLLCTTITSCVNRPSCVKLPCPFKTVWHCFVNPHSAVFHRVTATWRLPKPDSLLFMYLDFEHLQRWERGLLPFDTKNGESHRVFDEQCVVLCRHQQRRSGREKSAEPNIKQRGFVQTFSINHYRNRNINNSVILHTLECRYHPQQGTRPTPHRY